MLRLLLSKSIYAYEVMIHDHLILIISVSNVSLLMFDVCAKYFFGFPWQGPIWLATFLKSYLPPRSAKRILIHRLSGLSIPYLCHNDGCIRIDVVRIYIYG